MDYTDLGEVVFPHANEVVFSDSQEEVITTLNGGIVGDVLALKEDGELVDKTATPHYSNLAQVVGRIFVLYIHAGIRNNSIWYFGSGFKVGKAHVVTAKHVVKDSHEKDGKIYTLEEIYFCYKTDARMDKDFDRQLAQQNKLKNVYLMKKVVIAASADSHLQPDGTEWETKDDFCFLKLAEEKTWYHNILDYPFEKIPYATPKSSDFSTTDNCFVIGYPGKILYKKFADDYQSLYQNMSDSEKFDFFEKVREKFWGFESKIVSVGYLTKNLKDPHFILHNAPTIRGTSGGLLYYGDGKDVHHHFSAIHVGGNLEMSKNFAISVTLPSFKTGYSQIMRGDPDWKTIQKRCADYLE